MSWFKKKSKFRIIKTPQGDEVKLVEAFEWDKEMYYQVENAFQMATGRALCAITFYEEFQMRCDRDYLEKHCRAIDILMSDPKKLMIGQIAILHENLKERVKLAPYPDHIYKLASVMFFTKDESPFYYDFKFNAEKIKRWKEDPDLLPFLVTQPLKELTPFGELAKPNLPMFFNLKAAENELHNQKIQEILSRVP